MADSCEDGYEVFVIETVEDTPNRPSAEIFLEGYI